jgi:hypothetical protein
MTDERKQRTWTKHSKHTSFDLAESKIADLRKQGYVRNNRADDDDKAVKVRMRPDGTYDVMTSPRRPS